jgi:hypothetical protein
VNHRTAGGSGRASAYALKKTAARRRLRLPRGRRDPVAAPGPAGRCSRGRRRRLAVDLWSPRSAGAVARIAVFGEQIITAVRSGSRGDVDRVVRGAGLLAGSFWPGFGRFLDVASAPRSGPTATRRLRCDAARSGEGERHGIRRRMAPRTRCPRAEPRRVVIRASLADRVEVEVVGIAEFVSSRGISQLSPRTPRCAVVSAVDVVVVVVEFLLAAGEERCSGLHVCRTVSVAAASRGDVGPHGPVQVEVGHCVLHGGYPPMKCVGNAPATMSSTARPDLYRGLPTRSKRSARFVSGRRGLVAGCLSARRSPLVRLGRRRVRPTPGAATGCARRRRLHAARGRRLDR